MKADFRVLLDACVLANFAVCDLLLRLAERPRLFLPVWSGQVLEEVRRTQVDKLGWPAELADSFRREVGNAFPEAGVSGYEHLIVRLTNDFRAQQKLLSPARAGSAIEAQALAAGASETELEEEWMLDCVVDLGEPRPEDEPLLELVRIGT